MIDFTESFFNNNYYAIDGYDREKAKQKALQAVVPLIMDNELSPKQNICLRYKYINNKNQTEIAQILKLSQPPVSRHIAAAKDIMNNSLKYCYIALSTAIDEYERLGDMH